MRSVLSCLGAIGLAAILSACASAGGPSQDESVEERASVAAEPEEKPRFIVLSRTTPLYMAPDMASEQIFFRTPEEEQEAIEARARAQEKFEEDEAKRQERWEKAEERRVKNERRRARTADQKSAMRERQRDRREDHRNAVARRKLSAARSLAGGHAVEPPPRHMLVFRLVEESDEWMQVVTVPSRDPRAHCYRDGYPGLEGLELHFFVRRDEIHPVAVSQVQVKYSEYTYITLNPGVALRPLTQGRYVAIVDGFELPINVPGNQVGPSYEPGRYFPMPATDTIFSELALAESRLSFDRRHDLPYNPFFPLFITETLHSGRTVYATTQTPCGRYAVRVHEDHLDHARAATQDYTFKDNEDGGGVRRPFVRAGAALFTVHGQEIGRALEDTFLGVEVDPKGPRRCFERNVMSIAEDHIDDKVPDHRRLILCVAEEDAELLNLEVF
ncbi:MAG: hypothetical protein ACNA8W_05580 [Bradymonadaceae bacterium]